MIESYFCINRISQDAVLNKDGRSQCWSGETVRRLLSLFTPHYGLDQGSNLTRWRVVVEFYRYFEGNHSKSSCGLDVECEKKKSQ